MAAIPNTPSSSVRTGAGVKPQHSSNVAPINKPSKPAAHTLSPLPGKEPKSAISRAETMLKQQASSGKMKSQDDLNRTREAIAKKTGQWPNGYTN
jgi:hypothetical protein